MSLLRVLLAWCLLAAIPLQGLAGVTMVYCAPAAHKHDHAAHAHAVHASADGEGAAANDEAGGTLHSCSLCASCCHVVGIAEMPHAAGKTPASQASLDAPASPVHERPPTVLERPPRG